MCSLAPYTPAENRAQSALSAFSRMPVESTRSPLREAMPQPSFAAVHEFAQQPREYRARPFSPASASVERERTLAGAEMIKLAGVALEICLDRPQALAARQLRVQQGDKMKFASSAGAPSC